MSASVRLGLVLVIGLVGATISARRAPHPQQDDRTLILRLEDGWTNALLKRDRSYFTKTLAPGFVYTEDDRLSTREEVLRDVVTPSDTVTAAHNEGMVVHLFGSVAAVTGVLAVDGRANGAVYHHRYRFTDTWQKQPDGQWRLVAAQDYLIPMKKS